MKTLILLTLAFSSVIASADERILDCNLGMGPLQQVTVYDRGTRGIELANLNSSGRMIRHVLSEKEVQSRRINLRVPNMPGVLFYQSGNWYYRIGSPGFMMNGVADCWVDKI